MTLNLGVVSLSPVLDVEIPYINQSDSQSLGEKTHTYTEPGLRDAIWLTFCFYSTVLVYTLSRAPTTHSGSWVPVGLGSQLWAEDQA